MERGREKRGREGENSLRNQWQYYGQIKNEGEKTVTVLHIVSGLFYKSSRYRIVGL